MKKVIMKEELQEKMQESIHLLCGIVKETLGPNGKNVLIDHSLFSPFITNDGATIARNIESEDAIINTILEIAKESSLKTDSKVGDGTTTTLVLLESIFDNGLELIKKGMPPILFKKNLTKSLEKVLNSLKKEKHLPKNKEYESLSIIAANEEELGKFINQVYQKTKTKNGIEIVETDQSILSVQYENGYQFPIELGSPLFLKEQEKIFLENPVFLFVEDQNSSLEDYSIYLNAAMKNKWDVVFIAKNFSDSFIQECLYLNDTQTINCFLLKIGEYGIKESIIWKDIKFITSQKKNCKGITLTKEKAILKFTNSLKTQEYLKTIEEELKKIKDEFDEDFFKKRMAMFLNGLATIVLGAPTKIECHEKKMRLIDALCALESAKDGVVTGGGITFLKIANELDIKNETDQILQEALKIPFKQILLNSGLSYEKIKKTIEKEEYHVVFNVSKDRFEKVSDTQVIDSYNVLKQTLENACSIAMMLLTTSSLVINEQENNLGKINDYNEL